MNKKGLYWIIEDVMNLISRVDIKYDDSSGDYRDHLSEKSGKEIVVKTKKNFLYIKDKRTVHKYILQPKPNPYETKLLETLIGNLLKWDLKSDDDREYDQIKQKYILSAICEFISTDYNISKTIIEDLIYCLINWMGRRNEGGFPSFSFTFFKNSDNSNNSLVSYKSVINGNNFERLHSIENCSIELDKKGNIKSYISSDSTKLDIDTTIDVPIQFQEIVSVISEKAIDEGSYTILKHNNEKRAKFLTIMLVDGRDILIIKDGDLDFARRESQWKKFNDYLLIEQPILKDNRLFSNIIYKSLLDSTFSYGGSGILILKNDLNHFSNPKETNKLLEFIDEKYIVNERILKNIEVKSNDKFRDTLIKFLTLNAGVVSQSDSIKLVNRQLFKDLLSIDGSVILDCNGVIIAVGGMIEQLIPVNNSGARTAAALGASQLGLAIKVSEDGAITGYYNYEKSAEDIRESHTPSFILG